MTTCTLYIDDLKAYADGELSWLRRRIVARHLTRCASCREEIAAMTQITEDLRTAEPDDALPPSLREKLLAAPGTEDSSVAERISPDRSPALPVPGSRRNRRRLPAWTFAALAVAAWFIFYPMFQQVHEDAHRVAPAASLPDIASAPVAASQTGRQIKAFKRPPPAPQERPLPPLNATGNFTASASDQAAYAPIKAPPPAAAPAMPVRLSDREAGIGADGKSPVVYGNFGPRSLSINGNMLSADPDSLRQVHKEASIGLQVPNPEATGDTLSQMAQETGGYVAANNLTTGDDGLKSGELIVKVPEPQFEAFLAHVAKLGIVQSKNITGEDITEKTSDASQAQTVEESDLGQAEARLKALGTHAKWEDTQNAEDLRVQLAQTRARLLLLKRLAALSTLTIDLSQTPKAAAAPPVTSGFTGSLKAATHDALQSLVGSAGALLALVIWLLAYAPLWVPLLLLGRYALKEYKKREAA